MKPHAHFIAKVAGLAAVACYGVAVGEPPATQPAGVVRPGGAIEVTLHDVQGPGVATTLRQRVDFRGAVVLPFAGRVVVNGVTTDRAAVAVAEALVRQGVMRSPVVTVALFEPPGQPFPDVIAAGEKLHVTLFDLTGPGTRLVVHAQVGDDGTIAVPLAGPVDVEGMTEADAGAAIAKAYREKNVIDRMTLSIFRSSPAK
ncbi:MAG TPA: polysaccharide biosynthesis/export family protein [Tepidisphaeraceae bacterium]|jgi:protein involved in polysaccharide export with SLBB domain